MMERKHVSSFPEGMKIGLSVSYVLMFAYKAPLL
jgi:hypothetical protein